LCGRTILADIGIPDSLVAEHAVGLHANGPWLWRGLLPQRTPDSHKYRFGHALVVGGPVATTGAARLAAEAALRVGAGLVSVACRPGSLTTYAARLTTVMTKPVADAAALSGLLADPRYRSVLVGPGAGVGEGTRAMVLAALAAGRPSVLDADALTSFTHEPESLFAALNRECVLTPHDGEFARLFAVTGDRLSRARAASAACGAVVLLKGADTVVAAPDGRSAIQPEAPPWLATAGTGDVLAGLIAGLLAQGMPAFEAAASAAWLHAEAACAAGPGLIAEDLAPHLAHSLTMARTAG
jgi:NAD(P)H-hydrate epimerase